MAETSASKPSLLRGPSTNADADQASNTKKARYQKQRNKLTEDIRISFARDAQGIQALLGAQKVIDAGISWFLA